MDRLRFSLRRRGSTQELRLTTVNMPVDYFYILSASNVIIRYPTEYNGYEELPIGEDYDT
jgi:hypothetical protein